MHHRAVITGIGIRSPLGNSAGSFFSAALKGVSAVKPICKFDASRLAVRIGCEIAPDETDDSFSEAEKAEMPMAARWAVLAARQAVLDSGVELGKEDPYALGIVMGVSISSFQGLPPGCLSANPEGVAAVTPMSLAMANPASAATQISRDLGIQGEVVNVSSACSSAATAIAFAARMIASGESMCVLSGGADEGVTPFFLGAFSNAECLSRKNDSPSLASRPFDRGRDGSVLSDAACVLVVEEYQHALRRGANVYCEITGYGRTNDAASALKLGKSEVPGAMALQQALQRANCPAGQVDYYCAFGVSHPWLDIRETRMVKRAFGAHARRLPVSSVQSMMGHPMGTAGAIQAATCALAIRNGAIPPTINYEEADPECDLDYVPNVARQLRVRNAALYALGSGGNNAALVLSAC